MVLFNGKDGEYFRTIFGGTAWHEDYLLNVKPFDFETNFNPYTDIIYEQSYINIPKSDYTIRDPYYILPDANVQKQLPEICDSEKSKL